MSGWDNPFQRIRELERELWSLREAQASAWDEGWHTGQLWAFSDLDEHALDTNPYRDTPDSTAPTSL